MKRLVSLLMVFALMMISVAWAEEFTIHSGVRFGMSVDEVIAAEKANGFHAELNDSGDVSFEGQVAGYEDGIYPKICVNKQGSVKKKMKRGGEQII